MSHTISVGLVADVSKFDSGMAAARKTSSDSVGFIASIFSTVTGYFAKMWDAAKSFFMNVGEKGAGAWDSFKSSASGALDKVLSMLPGLGKATKDIGDEAEQADKKTDSWLSKIATGLAAVVGIAVTATAAVAALAAKGMLIDSAFAKISIATNVGAADLSKFQDVAKRSGMTVEQLGAGITTFQAAMKEAAAGTGSKVFADLGVSVKNSKNELRDTAPALEEFAKKVAGMSSEAEKYGAAAKSGFSVQYLEDLAHSGKLAAGTTDEQAAAVVRLGKIFHEILPGGVSVWEQISTALSNKLTPAMTTAAEAVLIGKNRMVNAFKDIFAGGDLFDKIGDKIAGWANDMAGYFSKVALGAADAGVKAMEYIAKLAGLGKPLTKPPSDGDIPKLTPTTSGKPEVVPTKADVDAAKKYDDWTKSVLALTEAQKVEIQTGAALTQGQRMQLALTEALRDGTMKESSAQAVSRQALIDKVLATEKQIASTNAARAAGEALAKKQADAYVTLTKNINEKLAASALEANGSIQLSESQRLTIKLNEDVRAGTIANTKANIDRARSVIAQIKVNEDVVASQKRAAAGAEAMAKIQKEYTDGQVKSIDEATKTADQNEGLVKTFGMTKSAIEAVELARLEEQLAQRASLGLTLDEIETLEKLIVAKKRSSVALATLDGLEEQKAMWESIDKTAHDTFVSIFDSGKSAFDRLRDTLKNGLMDLLYQMTVKKWIFNISGNVSSTGATAVAQGANALSSGGSLIGAAGNIYSTLSGGMTLAGGLGSGFMGSLAGGLAGAGAGSGLTSATGLAIGEGISSAVGSTVAGAMSSGLGMIAAAAPYLAAALAAYALYKHFDTGNTPHTGGASMATSAGVSTIRAESIGFEATKTSSDTEKLTASLATGVVGILNSTALAFGKTAGYSAATAFADDSSKDGAWGALVIDKLGEKIVNWQDTRTGGSWAPKVFADGEAGQAQYLAAMAASVRTALDSIGLPGWATKMLDNVGAGASIEDLAKVVDQINKTQMALKMMGDSLVGFASMSDKAVTSLIEASGGIDALASNASAYYDQFYSDSEKSASTIKAISDVLASVGVAMPATKEAFRSTVEAQMALGEAGAPAVAVLLKVAGAFAQAVPAIEAASAATQSASEILSQQADLQKQFDQLTMTSTQLRAKERLSINASNLALFDQITQLQTIKDTSDALKTSIETWKSFKTSMLAARDSIALGGLSTLNPMQKAAEAQRQYEDMLAKAKAGDLTAQAGIQNAATAYLTADQVVKASSDAYVNDALKVQADMLALADIAGAQISVDQLQLTALDNQVAGIASLNAEVKGLREDNAKLLTALEKQTAAVEDQTTAVVTVTLQAADSNAAKVNQGTMNAGQARNWKLALDGEAIPV